MKFEKIFSIVLIILDVLIVWSVYDWGLSLSDTCLLWSNGQVWGFIELTLYALVWPLLTLPYIVFNIK